MTKIYKYIDDGLGVSGLPHEITDDQAKDGGVEQILKEAVAAGLYQEVKPAKQDKPKKAARAIEPERVEPVLREDKPDERENPDKREEE